MAYWIDTGTGTPTDPGTTEVIDAIRQYATEGGAGVPPTVPGPEWFNMMTDEVLAVLALAGIAPSKADHGQLAKAIQSISFSAYPVGAPIPWPLATPPTGFLMMQGQSFSAVTYPKLALAYPALILPDMRAEFIRGWDNGRGVDVGRALLSAQGDAIRNLSGSVNSFGADGSTGTFKDGSGVFSTSPQTAKSLNDIGAIINQRALTLSINASLQVPTASENRPRNIAFNYIVRAA